MSAPPFSVAALDPKRSRADFRCGSALLDDYFQKQVTRDIKRRVASCFVLLDRDGRRIAGYYTLSSAGVPLDELPVEQSGKLPRYPSVPAVRLGRLAVDSRYQRRGLGGALLADALDRTLRSGIAAYAMIVDAKDEAAVSFYRPHGFSQFQSVPNSLFCPLETARKAREQ